ncbi:hypothetical protein PR048_021322 [Dryococelus australis]|uniref:Uncharacterized protein n=1 Tax=Dryococelus australis TaxID=614101 RepID=A0ABQ9GXV7_9NEOP|nr:hypothetical protein PR048_021322 [Dryococelus australis]
MAAYVLDTTVVTAIWQPALWSAIGYNMRSRLLRTEGDLNSNRYIREVLQPEVLPLLQATPRAIFQQDNTRPHVARNVQAFFNERRVPLLPWPARSPDMSPSQHVWDMVSRRLVRHGVPESTVDALWTHIQTAWREVPQEHIQVLFDSMPQRLGALISERAIRTRHRTHAYTRAKLRNCSSCCGRTHSLIECAMLWEWALCLVGSCEMRKITHRLGIGGIASRLPYADWRTTIHFPHRLTGFDSRRGCSGFSHVGIVPDVAVGRRVFSGISRFPSSFIPAMLHTNLALPSSALKTSMLRATQITSLTQQFWHQNGLKRVAETAGQRLTAGTSGSAERGTERVYRLVTGAGVFVMEMRQGRGRRMRVTRGESVGRKQSRAEGVSDLNAHFLTGLQAGGRYEELVPRLPAAEELAPRAPLYHGNYALRKGTARRAQLIYVIPHFDWCKRRYARLNDYKLFTSFQNYVETVQITVQQFVVVLTYECLHSERARSDKPADRPVEAGVKSGTASISTVKGETDGRDYSARCSGMDPPRPRSRSEGAIRATVMRTPSASSLLRARPAVFPARLLAARFSEPMRALEVRVEQRRNGGIPEKTRRPTASSGTIPTCEGPVTLPGIEPGSPWWEASELSARPPRPLRGYMLTQNTYLLLTLLIFTREYMNNFV